MFADQNQHLIRQIDFVLDQLSDEEYKSPLDVFNQYSIGQHVRHIIEFYIELQKGYEQGVVAYDRRKRCKILETDRNQARGTLKQLAHELGKDDKMLELLYHGEGEEERIRLATTYYRELGFVMEHTVHHMALIRIGVEALPRKAVPVNFGVAASTQQYLSSQTR